MNERMRGVYLKLKRAADHISDVDDSIRSFCDSRPYEIRSREHPIPAIQHITVYVARVTPIPEELALQIGDAIHNVRSALDHLACQLVLANGGKVRTGTSFPIRNPILDYDSTFYGPKIEGMSEEAKELILKMQPRVTGDNALWEIHQLDIQDKHRLLFVAGAAHGGWGVEMGADQTLWFPEVYRFPLLEGHQIVNIPTTTYLKQSNRDFKIELDVTFSEPHLLKDKPVLKTLNQYVDVATTLANKFEALV